MEAHLILQVPHSVFVSELFIRGSCLGQNAALKATHVEEEVGVVLGVDGDKGVLPLDGGDGARQAVLDVPEHSSAWQEAQWEAGLCVPPLSGLPPQVDIVFH